MKAVLDANVHLSGMLMRSSPPCLIMQLWRDKQIDLATSEHVLNGVRRALSKPYWQAKDKEFDLSGQLSRFPILAESVTPTDDVHGVGEDEEDDLVLATAVAARADYLVTGDQFLLDLVEFRGIQIVTPREFLEILATSDL